MSPHLTPRDWQMTAIREAAELVGTSAYVCKMVEVNRYKLMADELDAQAAQPEQQSPAHTCDLRGIDAGQLSEWVDLVKHGYVAKDECLIAVKDVPKWVAQNDTQPVQPSQALQVVARLLRVHEDRTPEDAFNLAAAMLDVEPSQALEMSELTSALRQGFCTTESCGPGHYAIVIKFASLEKLHRADDELRAAINAKGDV